MAAVPPLSSSINAGLRVGANPFSFGSLTFSSVDGPSSLGIGGGEQRMAVLEPVGGSKVVYATGWQPSVYEFSGSAYQPNIDTIVKTLRRYTLDGKERLVSWKGERYYGIGKTFPSPIYRNGGNRCDWRFGIEVTRDANGAFSGSAPKKSVDDANTSLLAGANANLTTISTTINANASAADAQTAAILASAQSSFVASGYTLQRTTPSVNASASQITTAVNAISGSLGVAQQLAARFPSAHLAFVPAQAIIAALTVLGANLRSIQIQNVTQQQGGSFYAIAATKYGDVSRAFDLMTANGATSPRLVGDSVKDVILPPFSTR